MLKAATHHQKSDILSVMQLAPVIPLTGRPVTIRDGMPGIFQTIAVMRSLVKHWRLDPAIRQAAVSVIWLAPEKASLHEVTTLFEYVRDNVRYVRDIVNVETIATPDKTMLCRMGDCDDQTVLLASLLESVGYPTRFVVAAYSDPRVMEHVYLQVYIDGHWIDCDPTEKQALGYAPPNPLAAYIENV